MFHTTEGFEGLLNQLMAGLPGDIGNKTDPAGIPFFHEPGLSHKGFQGFRGRSSSVNVHRPGNT